MQDTCLDIYLIYADRACEASKHLNMKKQSKSHLKQLEKSKAYISNCNDLSLAKEAQIVYFLFRHTMCK